MANKFRLDDCIALATFAHRNQFDKAGEPYIGHPLRVLETVKAQGAQPFVQMAAVLHDVTEDTPFTPEMLLAFGVPEAAVEIVSLVDRDISAGIFNKMYPGHMARAPKDPEFLARRDRFYYAEIKKNPYAVQVKLADIGDNTQPWRVVYLPKAKQESGAAKYKRAVELLTS